MVRLIKGACLEWYNEQLEEHKPMKHTLWQGQDLGLRKVWTNYCHRNLRQEGACASGIWYTLFRPRSSSASITSFPGLQSQLTLGINNKKNCSRRSSLASAVSQAATWVSVPTHPALKMYLALSVEIRIPLSQRDHLLGSNGDKIPKFPLSTAKYKGRHGGHASWDAVPLLGKHA